MGCWACVLCKGSPQIRALQAFCDTTVPGAQLCPGQRLRQVHTRCVDCLLQCIDAERWCGAFFCLCWSRSNERIRGLLTSHMRNALLCPCYATRAVLLRLITACVILGRLKHTRHAYGAYPLFAGGWLPALMALVEGAPLLSAACCPRVCVSLYTHNCAQLYM